MVDARKLRNGVRKPRLAAGEEMDAAGELLITSDYAMWTAPPFGKVKPASGGHNVQLYAPDIDPPGAD